MFSASVRFARANVLQQTVRVARLSSTLPPQVKKFVDKAVALCRPDKVHVCTGSQQEYDTFLAELIKAGTVIKLDQAKRPGCYAAFTNPADVARAEKDTYICSEEEKDAGPTNNWVNPAQKREQLKDLFNGSMRGRTMYVVPFSMGPLGSPFSKIGIQVTDSSFVVANMRIMTRMGTAALEKLGTTGDFVPCMHSVGQPIVSGTENTEDGKLARSTWPCNIKNRNVVQFPESREIWSFGSGYGGNSLLGKKCFALRIASVQARDEGWLAEHMLILGITNPQGVKRYIAAAFPSACGKTNLAMMQPNLPGWKIETVGDDIAWMRPGADGRLYAINPEYGFFGVAPGTSSLTNPNAMKTCAANSLFTNVGVTNGGDVYWEGMDAIPDDVLTDWKGRKNWLPTLKPNFKGKGTGWNKLGYKIDEKTEPCAQPNSRFTTPITQCPVLDPKWEDPAGVPISAIMFGGRRNDTLPLIFETESWQHGTFAGSIMRSEATSAADQVGLTNDPMAMKAFCGYNVKDYFAHWLRVGSKSKNMPKVFQVNWFRKNAKGDFLWPGFGDNIRVLKWIFERCENPSANNFQSTPIGRVPKPDALDVSNLKVSPDDMKELLHVDKKLWLKEAKDARAYYADLSKKTCFKEPSVPTELFDELRRLEQRLQ